MHSSLDVAKGVVANVWTTVSQKHFFGGAVPVPNGLDANKEAPFFPLSRASWVTICNLHHMDHKESIGGIRIPALFQCVWDIRVDGQEFMVLSSTL